MKTIPVSPAREALLGNGAELTPHNSLLGIISKKTSLQLHPNHNSHPPSPLATQQTTITPTINHETPIKPHN